MFDFQKNYFELFALPLDYDVDLLQLKRKHREVILQTHPDRFVNATPQEKRLALQYSAYANEGLQILTSSVKRSAYLLGLLGCPVDFEKSSAMSPNFLMKQMHLREQLAVQRNDQQAMQQLKCSIEKEITVIEKQLHALFLERSQDALSQARELTLELRFFEKLMQEIR